MLPPDQRRVIKQANFTHSILVKVLENLSKLIKYQREKQIKAIKNDKNQI